MSRADIIRFYAATPVWFWPVLAWNLYGLRRHLDARAASETFLVRIHLGPRGRLRLEWLARPERAAHWPLSHSGPPRHALFDLDHLSRAMDAAQLCGAAMLARAARGDTLAALIAAAGFAPLPQPEPD